MSKSNTVATNARVSAQAAKTKFNKKSLLGKAFSLTTNVLYWTGDSAHALLSGANAGVVNLELKVAGSNDNMGAYVAQKNKDIAKKGLFGLAWSLLSSLFTSNKRSRHLGSYTNEKVESAFFKDCIAKWSVSATKEEKKDMKIVLRLLKSDGKDRKSVVETVEVDFDKSGYPDVESFFIQSMSSLKVRVELYKDEAAAYKENRKRS